MNYELFIAKRLVFGSKNKNNVSGKIVRIALFGIALGLAVMIITVAIVTGFKKEIRNKVIGFGSHIQIVNLDSNSSYETSPINNHQSFIPELKNIPGVSHVQQFATKPGIIKTDSAIQGVVLKGVGADFDWRFFQSSMVEGSPFTITDSSVSNQIVLSRYLAKLLKLKLGDNVIMFFVQEPPRMRKFVISGIYETNLEEMDKVFVLADLRHIQSLNNWDSTKISGFEIFISDFDDLDQIHAEVSNIVSAHVSPETDFLRAISTRDRNPQIFDWLDLQNMNVLIILLLMLIVAGINMVSGLLIMILDRINMIGSLKSMGTSDRNIQKIFLYQSFFLIGKGLLWGNLIGIGICLFQYYTRFITLDQSSYYIAYVPINLNWESILALNLITLVSILIMMVLPTFIISRIDPARIVTFR